MKGMCTIQILPNSFTLKIHNLNSIPIQHLFKCCFSARENNMYYHAETPTYCNLQFLGTAHHALIQLVMFCICAATCGKTN